MSSQISAKLPIDSNGEPVQTLSFGTNTFISVGGSSARSALPAGYGQNAIVRLASDTNCFVAFGDSGVTASISDPLFPVGVEVVKVPENATHVAVVQSASGGTLTITGMD